ncbi:hypothetical protein AB2B41_18345 [Marimonas sp. MJW-29]|uniref:Uncharacterized protein n=1 Tax=Sulfitobacter sediminis TaxID=3234186 RepID=A0ABV3RRJ5_9RHOB
MVVKISVSISDQQAEYARRQVAEGRASSTSAVIQQALEAKRREDEAFEAEKEAFVAMLEERAKGPFLELPEFRQRVDQMIERKTQERGLESDTDRKRRA